MKLNRRGDVVYPHPTGLYVNDLQISARHATDASWISDDEIACQLDGLTGWRVVRMQDFGGSQIVAPYGASPVRAGGGTIAWWTLEGGVQVDGVLQKPEWRRAGLCDVSPEGRIVITNDYQVGKGLNILDADGTHIGGVPTTPLGAASVTGYNVRLRGMSLLWQDDRGWHIAGETPQGWIDLVPRTEPIALAVHAPMPNGRIVIMELSERLTVRYADTSKGVVISELDTFYPDMRAIGDETLELAWSIRPDELPQYLERAQVTLHELDNATFDLNAHEPPKPVDCQVGEWVCSGWLPDDHGTTESRTCWRKVTQQPANGGKPCPELSKIETRPIEEPPMPVPTDRQKQIEALGFKCYGGFYPWVGGPQDTANRVLQVANIGADVMQNTHFVPSEFEAGQGLNILATLGFDTPEAQQAVRRFFEGRK